MSDTTETFRRLHAKGLHDAGIASEMDISRQRVGQIRKALKLKKNPLPPRLEKPWRCQVCDSKKKPEGSTRPAMCNECRKRPTKFQKRQSVEAMKRYEKMASAYEESGSITGTARDFKVCQRTVWKALVATGTARKYEGGWSKPSRLKATKGYEKRVQEASKMKGKSRDEVAEALGVTADTAATYLMAARAR